MLIQLSSDKLSVVIAFHKKAQREIELAADWPLRIALCLTSTGTACFPIT